MTCVANYDVEAVPGHSHKMQIRSADQKCRVEFLNIKMTTNTALLRRDVAENANFFNIHKV